jgi:hypothetical protein
LPQNERHQELILEMAEMKKYGAGSIGHESLSDAERPSDNLEIDEIMAKLEQVPILPNTIFPILLIFVRVSYKNV